MDKRGTGLVLNGLPYYVAGMNYYPKDTPWDKFWPNYNPAVIDHDFALIQSLHLNTIRIFIPFAQFGGPNIEMGQEQPSVPSTGSNNNVLQMPLEKLSDLLYHADRHDLKVIVTLFDFRSDYSLLHWPDADRQLETLLTYFKNNPTILAWDLKNEPDLDYRTAGKEVVNSWLAHIARLARSYDPYHLLTVGWSTPIAAETRIAGVDFVEFHYYASASNLAHQYAALRTAVPEQPIILGEFGMSTWNSFLFPGGHSEAEQADYYSTILRFWRTTDSAGYLAWTLYDFSHVPANVAGGLPWQTASQGEMGVIRRNGTLKPAARLLAPDASLRVAHVSGLMLVLKPFWLTVTATIVTILTVFVFKKRGRWIRGFFQFGERRRNRP